MLPRRVPEKLVPSGQGLKEAVQEFKLNYILETIEQCGGNQRKASKILKIQPSYLSRILHKQKDRITN
jgi:DNA-binding NtrC family response regulator